MNGPAKLSWRPTHPNSRHGELVTENLMRSSSKAVATLGLFASAACASSQNGPEPMYRPEVSVNEVRLSGIGISGGSMNIDLELRNPNRFRIEAPIINYRVLV